MSFFKQMTTGQVIIMGRKTFESIGRPLPNRFNIVVTRNKDFKADGVLVVHSLDEALTLSVDNSGIIDLRMRFIIGGAELWKEAIPKADLLYITVVGKDYEGDTYFPTLNPDDWIISHDSGMVHSAGDEAPLQFITFISRR